MTFGFGVQGSLLEEYSCRQSRGNRSANYSAVNVVWWLMGCNFSMSPLSPAV